MIHFGSVQSFYDAHKSEILNLVYNEQKKKVEFAKTSHIYLDKKGRSYNHYENPNDLPIERYGKVLEFMQLISKGLTAQEDELLDNEMSEALQAGLRNEKEKSAVKIGAILNEKAKRRKLCIHTELIYNYLVVQWVRDDENPFVFDNEIHMDKVSTLQEENKEGIVSFFFQQPELKRLRDLLAMSKGEWEKYTNEYLVQAARLKELLLQTASQKLQKQENATSGK